jgi:hypothetical protein
VATFHALRCLADIFAAFHDEETALNLFYTALEGATTIDIHRLRAECMAGIGDIMTHRGNIVKAKQMWEAAHPLFLRSSQTKAAAAIEARLATLSLTQESQVNRVDSGPLQPTMNQITKNLEQLNLLSVPQNTLSTNDEASLLHTSADDSGPNAPVESDCPDAAEI